MYLDPASKLLSMVEMEVQIFSITSDTGMLRTSKCSFGLWYSMKKITASFAKKKKTHSQANKFVCSGTKQWLFIRMTCLLEDAPYVSLSETVQVPSIFARIEVPSSSLATVPKFVAVHIRECISLVMCAGNRL